MPLLYTAFDMETIFEPRQLSLFDGVQVAIAPAQPIRKSQSGSFVSNMKLPVHRWFRYSAGFSAEWVRHLVQGKTFQRKLFVVDYADDSPESRLLWLALTAILRSCSFVGTAQWQYVLPSKRKAKVLDPMQALKAKANEIVEDVAYAQDHGRLPLARVVETDARQPEIAQSAFVDLVITSPYPNNYDYADATRLEMTYWGQVESWGDLQSTVRTHLIRSCSQHAAAERLVLESILQEPILAPIRDELGPACHRLAEIRLTRGGRKTYHTMAAAYFADMAHVFQSLRSLCRVGSELCFVIGDSAPYGVYLSVDEWLGKLAVAQGFASYRFEKIRDRNLKWKNRKHRVPLKEGRLWIEG